MLIGHQRIWDFLTQSAAKNRLAHAYLFAGPAQVGKKTMALELVKFLFCQNKIGGAACQKCKTCADIAKNQHPDLCLLTPRQEERGGVIKTLEVGIDEIKLLQHQLNFFPYSAPYKVAIIEEMASLTSEATNSFLKTLEEPGPRTLIILVTNVQQAILPTIISRCQLIKFLPVPSGQMAAALKKLAKESPDLEKIIRLAAGRPGRAIGLIEDTRLLVQQDENIKLLRKSLGADLVWRWDLVKGLSQDVSLAQETLGQWILWLRDRLLENANCKELALWPRSADKEKYSSQSLVGFIKEIQKTATLLNNPSFNSRLALEVLMMKI